MNKLLEICVDNFESAELANLGGADRIELCSALSEGGLTPSFGFAKECIQELSVKVFPMIRPRGGHFVYSKEELQIMIEDIHQFKSIGVHGIVTGVLDKENKIDEIAMRRLINAARPLPVTFHRAFDVSADPWEAMNMLIHLKVDRLLTSGQKEKAYEGIELIKNLQQQFGEAIKIMAGSGVNSSNISELLTTGINEFHGSAKMKGQFTPDMEEIKRLKSAIA